MIEQVQVLVGFCRNVFETMVGSRAPACAFENGRNERFEGTKMEARVFLTTMKYKRSSETAVFKTDASAIKIMKRKVR